jgi:hypothetical protein
MKADGELVRQSPNTVAKTSCMTVDEHMDLVHIFVLRQTPQESQPSLHGLRRLPSSRDVCGGIETTLGPDRAPTRISPPRARQNVNNGSFRPSIVTETISVSHCFSFQLT